MVDVTTAGEIGMQLLAVLVTGYFAVIMWRRRSAPTARPMLILAGCLLAGSLGHALLIHATPVRRLLSGVESVSGEPPVWFLFLMILVVVGGGFWFLFALQYSGRGGRLVPLAAGWLVLYWAVVAAVAGASAFDVLAVDTSTVTLSTGELVLILAAYLMGVAMIVGSVLVLAAAPRPNGVLVGEAAAFAGGGCALALAPVVTNVLKSAVSVPVTLAVASGAFAVAVGRYPAFEAPPVARIAGRDRLIEEMDGPFVVADRDGTVRDLNPAAENYFETDAETARSAPLDALLPTPIDPERLVDEQEPLFVRTDTGATLACTATTITDERDRFFGHLLVFRDVTDRRRRDRRLGVLTQLLAGPVSERVAAIEETVAPVATREPNGAADRDEDGPAADATAVGSAVREETARLLDLVAWTREIERSLAAATTGPVPVMAAVRDAVDAAVDDDVDVTITEPDEVGTVSVDRRLVETVFEMLLTDALDRGADAVRIEAAETDGGVAVRLVADGPATSAATPTEYTTAGADDGHDALRIETAGQVVRRYGGRVTVETKAGTRRTIVELPTENEGRRRERGRESPSTRKAGATAADTTDGGGASDR